MSGRKKRAASRPAPGFPRIDPRPLYFSPLHFSRPIRSPLARTLHVEIEEAFDRIGQDLEATACGHAVLARLWALSKEILALVTRL